MLARLIDGCIIPFPATRSITAAAKSPDKYQTMVSVQSTTDDWRRTSLFRLLRCRVEREQPHLDTAILLAALARPVVGDRPAGAKAQLVHSEDRYVMTVRQVLHHRIAPCL